MAAQTQTKRRTSKKKKTNGHNNKLPDPKPAENAVGEPSSELKTAKRSLIPDDIEPIAEEIPLSSAPATLEPDTTSPEQMMLQIREVMHHTTTGLESLLSQLSENNLLPNLDADAMLHSLKQVDLFLDKPSFVIGFAGGFNAGKSKLINALLGEDILKDGAVPTTSTVTRIVACPPGQEEMVIQFFSPDEFEELFDRYFEDFAWLYKDNTEGPPPHGRDSLRELLKDIEFLREQIESREWNDRIRSLDSFYDLIVAYINHHKYLEQGTAVEPLTRKTLNAYTTKSENSVAPLVREVRISLHHPMLAEGSQLIDLPGLGSPDPRDEEITVAALRGDPNSGKRECDAVVHVMDSMSPFRQGEDRLFQIYRKVWGETFSRRVFLVVSRWGKLETEEVDGLLQVGKSIRKVADRFSIDRRKIFIVDGRIGASTEISNAEQLSQEIERHTASLRPKIGSLENFFLPSGQNLFDATCRVMADGNVPALREAMQFYLATYKEYLNLSDALRLIDNLVSRIHQAASLELPPIEQLEDDETQFIEQCRSDFDRVLRTLRQNIRKELPSFLQTLLQGAILPRDMSGWSDSLYLTVSQQLDEQSPEQLQQQVLTHQLQQSGPLTSPIPSESFRFLFQKAVQRLDAELEQFCSAVSHQTIQHYKQFLFEDLGLLTLIERAFGSSREGRVIVAKFQNLMQQLERDLQLVARNLNRVFFYEYSDIYHRRDTNDALVDIRQELEEYLGHELSSQPSSAGRATRWLLRHKMEHHLKKLGTFLPLTFLQQVQETHNLLNDQLEEASFAIRQAYLERLERQEIGQEVDRIRHQYRQTRACLEQLAKLRTRTSQAQNLLQQPAFQR